MKSKYIRTSLLAIFGIAACLPSLSATTISAGQTANPDIFPTSIAGYSFVDSTGSQNVNPLPGTSFNATYTESIYKDAANVFCPDCLDFFILLSNAGPGVVERISTANFGSYLTDVGYRPTSGGTVPLNVDRSANGDIIGFNFIPTGSPISADNSSVLLEIQTNATNYTAGTVSVQDGTAGFAAGFAPASTAPEPVSMSLLGSGLLGLGFFRKRVKS